MKTKTTLVKGNQLAKTHGCTVGGKREKIYKVWCSMRSRCKDPRPKMAKNYRDKNITVCEQWDDFINFRRDMGEMPSKEHEIDRIDSLKGYYLENCRWATRKENVLNTSKIRWITFNHETKSLSQWAKDLGLHIATLRSRLDIMKWSIERAFTFKKYEKLGGK